MLGHILGAVVVVLLVIASMGIDYHANFHSESYRSSRPSNNVAFSAASDSVAGTVAAELGNWTTGRLTSLYGATVPSVPEAVYTEGTEYTVNAVVSDSSGAVSRVRFRNGLATLTTADVSALLTGVVGTSGISAGFTALSGPPGIPGTGNAIAVVNSVTIVDKGV